MKKVVLLGDSIRLWGYGPLVPARLGEGYTIWQPEDNGRFAAYTLRMAFDYQNEMKGSDVIHWNCGLWDMCDLFGDGPFTPLPTYVEQIKRIAKVLLTYAPAVIFATSTVPAPAMWGHSWARVRAYNDAATQALLPMGVRINDLYTPVALDHERMLRDDMLHLSDYGADIIADRVAEAIRAAGQA